MGLILSTGCNESYFHKPIFQNYLKSIKDVSQADKNLVFSLDFLPSNHEEKISYILSDSKKIKTPNSNFCLQHGAFLESSEHHLDDNDVLIFTDGDIILQRWFDPEELDWVLGIGKNEVMVGYNMSCYNTAKISINHIGMSQNDIKNCVEIFQIPLEEIPDYNTGVVIAKVSMWKKILQDYNNLAPKVLPLIPGFWGQQFVLNASIARKSFHKRLPYQIHTHSHHINQDGFGMPILPTLENNKICYRGKTVVFAHRFFGFHL